ncbi:HTH domain-containing protein [Candidatus Woesearchaeota archaeon]|nr:HTH domain-containing protein [Candidatus Woesearchaeota archaeon]
MGYHFQQRVTIVRMRKPEERNINHELQWLGDSLGLFNERDRDKSCYRVFIELLKMTKKRQPISSDGLAGRLHLTRGTVVHHLNRLLETGMVIHEGRKYLLRVPSLSGLIEEVAKDMARAFEDLKDVAEEVDKRLS